MLRTTLESLTCGDDNEEIFTYFILIRCYRLQLCILLVQ